MRQAIMRRSQLQNKVFKYGSAVDIYALKKHKNYCNRLAKRERKKYYGSLNEKDVTDNKKFWKTVKPFFTDKGGTRDRIMLLENDEIVSEEAQVAEIFNDYFQKSGSMASLGITENSLLLNYVCGRELDVENCINTLFQVRTCAHYETNVIFQKTLVKEREKLTIKSGKL